MGCHLWGRTESDTTEVTQHRQQQHGFPGGSISKETAYNAGDMNSVPGYRRPLVEENGNPLQYFHLEISWTKKPGEQQCMGSQRVKYD